jgi:hypothetical protein
MLQLEQAHCRLDLIHFAIDTWAHDGDLIGKTKVFQISACLV